MAEERESQKRQIACKVRINDVLNGRFVQEEGWQPNYIEMGDGRKISRVNVIGAVVAKEDGGEVNYNSIVIDDGTEKISVRVFGDDIGKLQNIGIGDVVLIIGRPREYGSERYILLEIIKNIENKKWIDVRNLELGKTTQALPKKEEKIVEEERVEETSLSDKIIDYIKKADKGDGVDMEEVINEFKDEDAVKQLLSEGELFEVRPGRVKVLE